MNFIQKNSTKGNVLEIEININELKKKDFVVSEKYPFIFVSRISIPIKSELQQLYSIPPAILCDSYVIDHTFGLAVLNIQHDFQLEMLDMVLWQNNSAFFFYRQGRRESYQGDKTMNVHTKEHYEQLIKSETEIKEIPKSVEFKWRSSIHHVLISHPDTCLFKGKLILKIEPKFLAPRLKETFKTKLYDTLAQEKNFTITCQGKSFHFNKSILSSVSEVFERMIQNPNSKEAKESNVEIKDFSLETIKTFEKILVGNEKVVKKELTMELKMFAHKYFIEPLEKECNDYIKNNLSLENIFDVIKGAYLGNDKELFKAAFNFVKENLGTFQESEEWNDLKKTHPECMAEMMYFLMFNQK